jgi:hypothetical protein
MANPNHIIGNYEFAEDISPDDGQGGYHPVIAPPVEHWVLEDQDNPNGNGFIDHTRDWTVQVSPMFAAFFYSSLENYDDQYQLARILRKFCKRLADKHDLGRHAYLEQRQRLPTSPAAGDFISRMFQIKYQNTTKKSIAVGIIRDWNNRTLYIERAGTYHHHWCYNYRPSTRAGAPGARIPK